MLKIIKKLETGADVRTELEKYCDEVTSHPLGNITGLIRGTDNSAESIMLAVHTDMPHFICTHTSSDSTVNLSPVGSLKRDGAAFCELASDKGIRGILLCEDSENEPLFKADIGKSNGRADFGDRFSIVRKTCNLTDEIIAGFGLSVTAPAAALLDLTRVLNADRPKRNVYFAFTTEGQYDFKLYATAARETDAKHAVCIGFVDAAEDGIALGKGAYARLCDKSFSSDKPLSDSLVSAGAAPLVMSRGICAASRIQVNGTPSAQLDLPVKYPNTVCECVSISDIISLRDTLTDLCQK